MPERGASEGANLLPSLQKVCIGLEVVSDLGRQTANIDRVCSGQTLAFHAGSKDVFHAGLRIVKIAFHGAYVNILTLLGDHLGSLYLRHAAVGIEHADLYAFYIRKTCQGSFAGITGGGSQNCDILLHPLHTPGGGQQLGQHTKRHIFKGRGGTPEQLQHRKFTGIHSGCQLGSFKLAGIRPLHQCLHIRYIRQHRANDPLRHFHSSAFQAFFHIQFRQASGNIQTAVRCQTLQHCLSAVDAGFI